MSEKELFNAILRAEDDMEVMALLECALAAAEERGRRRGVEEAIKAAAKALDSHRYINASKVVRALAPRDSGKDVYAVFDAAAEEADVLLAKDRK